MKHHYIKLDNRGKMRTIYYIDMQSTINSQKEIIELIEKAMKAMRNET